MTARRIAQIAGMIYVFALSGSAFAGNIEEGIAAYNRAYYATAVSKFTGSSKSPSAG